MPVAHVITFAQRGRQRSAIQIRVVREFCWRLGAQQRCDGRAFAAEAPQADHRVQAAPAAVELAQMVVCGLICLRACMASHARCSLARVACIQTELDRAHVAVCWLRKSVCAVAWAAAGCTRMVSQSKANSISASPGAPKSRKSSPSLPCMSSGARRRAALPPVRSARKATCEGCQAACLQARRTWPDAAQAASRGRGSYLSAAGEAEQGQAH